MIVKENEEKRNKKIPPKKNARKQLQATMLLWLNEHHDVNGGKRCF